MAEDLKPIEALKKELPQLSRLMQLNAAPGTDIQAFATQEIEYLRLHALTKPEINDCHPGTVVLAVKGVIKKNLSLDPTLNLVYVMSRQVTIGKDQQGRDIKVKALVLKETANGLLSVARQAGRILDHKRPEVEFDHTGKVKSVTFEILKPSTPEPRWETYTFSDYDFERWKIASHKDSGRWKDDFKSLEPGNLKYASEHYTNWRGGIDPEFARAKAIKHSLGKLGTNPYEGRIKSAPFSAKDLVDIPVEKQFETSETEDIQHTEIVAAVNQTNQNKPASTESYNSKDL